MPIMHSENPADGALCLNAFQLLQKQAQAERNTGMATLFGGFIKSAVSHKEALDKFGRYPTRNEVLGRKNTPAEEEYLIKAAGQWGQ